MLAIITDSTCDLSAAELEALEVRSVPLYVRFQDKTFKDWLEIDPKRIIEGVAAGAELPKTSQPSPEDFPEAYRVAIAGGASEILCLTISSELSKTYERAYIAAEEADVPVTVFDSRAASIGLGDMVKEASRRRGAGAGLDEIVKAIEHIRDSNFLLFTVGTLDFLQKGGRIGAAGALLGSLLNIKPILGLEDGKVVPLGRARGSKRALREVMTKLGEYRNSHPGELVISFVHIQDAASAEALMAEVDGLGIEYENGGVYEMGSVITSHVGPNTYGLYAHTKPS